MSPRVRLILYLAAGIVLGIAIGADIADESFGLAEQEPEFHTVPPVGR